MTVLALLPAAFGADVAGVVVDTAGQPVAHALVTLSSPVLLGGALQRETDAEGRFVASGLPDAAFTALVQKEGYVGAIVSVSTAAEPRIALVPGVEQVPLLDERKTVDLRGDHPLCGKKTDAPDPCGLTRIPSGMTYEEVVGSRATPPPAEE